MDTLKKTAVDEIMKRIKEKRKRTKTDLDALQSSRGIRTRSGYRKYY